MNYLVSVIIPVYQVSNYIERCLLSVISQTYKNIECIIVDDATEDDSIEKCERLIKEYNDNVNLDHNLNGKGRIRFKILHHEVNRGLSAARNTGTEAATGEYLYYLDSDDYISPDCIEKLISYVIKDDSIEMVQGGCLRKENGKESLWKCSEIRLYNNDEVRKQYHLGTLNGAVWNKLLKRAFVIDHQLYNKEGIVNEDLLWSFYLVKNLNNAQLCKYVTHFYFIRPDSILTDSGSKRRGMSYVEIFGEILQNLTRGREKLELKRYCRNLCVALAKYYRDVPELNSTLKDYNKKVKQYDCWSEYIIVSSVALVSRFCNPLGVLVKLSTLRSIVLKWRRY